MVDYAESLWVIGIVGLALLMAYGLYLFITLDGGNIS